MNYDYTLLYIIEFHLHFGDSLGIYGVGIAVDKPNKGADSVAFGPVDVHEVGNLHAQGQFGDFAVSDKVGVFRIEAVEETSALCFGNGTLQRIPIAIEHRFFGS